MGHFCKICRRTKANERFSGGGHRIHVCKECQRLPVAEREARRAPWEIGRFLRQSRISEKNVKRLSTLSESPDPEVAEWARLALEVARAKPGRRKRLAFLNRHHPELVARLEATGLIEAMR